MNALLSTSSSLSVFSLLSLKLPHSILCNTGLARARRKLFAGKVLDDDLHHAHAIKIRPLCSDNVRVQTESRRGDSLEENGNVLQHLLVRQFTNLII